MPVIASAAASSDARYRVHIDTEGHQLASDEPASAGGEGQGPPPYALLLSALASCTAITLRMYADRKGWALGTIRVVLRHHKERAGTEPLEHIEREIGFGAPLDEDQRARLAEIADKTPVTRTLRQGVPIATRMV
jgi:putative redox protein